MPFIETNRWTRYKFGAMLRVHAVGRRIVKPRDVLHFFLLSAIWGASFLLISIAVRSFPPAWVALLRLTFGAALLWAVMLSRGRKLPPRGLIVWLLLVAFFNNAIPFLLFPLGERAVPSNIAAVLNATTPIWTLLLGLGFMGKKAESGAFSGVVLGFCGRGAGRVFAWRNHREQLTAGVSCRRRLHRRRQRGVCHRDGSGEGQSWPGSTPSVWRRRSSASLAL